MIIVFCACGLGYLCGCSTEKNFGFQEDRYFSCEYVDPSHVGRLCMWRVDGCTSLEWWDSPTGISDDPVDVTITIPKGRADKFWQAVQQAGAAELQNYGHRVVEECDYYEYVVQFDGKTNRFIVYDENAWDPEYESSSLQSKQNYNTIYEAVHEIMDYVSEVDEQVNMSKMKEDRYISYEYDGPSGSGRLRLWRQDGDTILRWDNAGWDAGSWGSEEGEDWGNGLIIKPVHMAIDIPKERADKFWQQLHDLGVMEMKDVGHSQMEENSHEFVVQIDGRTNRFILWDVHEGDEKDNGKPEEKTSNGPFKSYKYDMLYRAMREIGDYAWEVHEATKDK